MKWMASEREFHKLLFYAKKIVFDFFPVLPGFARTPHIYVISPFLPTCERKKQQQMNEKMKFRIIPDFC